MVAEIRKLSDQVCRIRTTEFVAWNGLPRIGGVAHLRFIERQRSVATPQRGEAGVAPASKASVYRFPR
jgi:hypothetical protein